MRESGAREREVRVLSPLRIPSPLPLAGEGQGEGPSLTLEYFHFARIL
jgi:hypothetical protein